MRQNRIHEMVARLNRLHIPLRAETVFALANCHSPGRPHVGRALVQEGFCASLDEAFDRFLKKNRPAYVPKFKISALEAIALIHQAGGLASMAHPGLNRSDEVIPALAASGLDGLECFHSKHTAAMSRILPGDCRPPSFAGHRRLRLPRLQQRQAPHRRGQAARRLLRPAQGAPPGQSIVNENGEMKRPRPRTQRSVGVLE